jgi:hypothetical protein
MASIPRVAEAMQTVLTNEADRIAGEKRFVQRESKMGGAEFAQTLAFGWMSNSQATLEQLAQTAASLGVEISPQGLDERFKEEAADYLQEVLAVGVRQVITAQAVAMPILERFSRVYIQDSTVLQLPEELVSTWLGCGGTGAKGKAAIKAEVRWELKKGQLIGPYLEDGRVNENHSLIAAELLPEGALMIADLGYWSLKRMRTWADTGRYWLSYLRFNTAIYTEGNQRQSLLALLKVQGSPRVEIGVYLGGAEWLPARLLAVRVRQEVADRRRQKIHDVARKMQRSVNPDALALADWTVIVTNVPAQLLSLREALLLIRVRWQVELLFKLWKSHGRIDEWRSEKPWRILCEIYMKLLGMLIYHWIFLVSFWQFPDRSLFKAAQTVQRFALALASSFRDQDRLIRIIATIQFCLSSGCRINKSRKYRRSFQLLLDIENGALA